MTAAPPRRRFRQLEGERGLRVRFYAEWFEREIPADSELARLTHGDLIEVEGHELTVWDVREPWAKSTDGDLHVHMTDRLAASHRDSIDRGQREAADRERRAAAGG